jgi:predicted deacylase
MNTHIEVFKYDSGRPGTALAVMGAVHGNEICGAIALKKLKARIDAGAIVLKAGRLILVPVANPEGYAQNKRYIDRNLNRKFYPKPESERHDYEDHLDNQICAALDGVNYLLDIHSYDAEGPPFIFIGGKFSEEKKFALSLGVSNNFIWGWSDAFRNSNIPEKESYGAVEYIRTVGGRSITLECGQHKAPGAPDVAYVAAVNAMAYHGLIDAAAARSEIAGITLSPLGQLKYAKMLSVIPNAPGMTLARSFRHFETLEAGTELVRQPDKAAITAPVKGYAIMPWPEAPIGEGILYFARDEEPFPGQ